MGESINVKVDDFTAPKGDLELTGSGIKTLSCSKHSFTKSGQEISTDLSDCLPTDVAVNSVEYCSDQDAISVTVKDKSVPLPITAQLTRVDCATMEAEAPLTCSGSADPIVKATQCYSGSAGALGLKENVNVKIDDFTAPKGDLELTGDGIKTLSCSKHSFSKSGQEISTDLSDCLPSGVAVRSIKYCSDQDAISVSVKDKSVPFPIKAQLTRVDCP